MHLLRPRILMRLIVPTLETTLLKCIPAQAPCALAFENIRVDAIEIPTRVGLFSEGVEDFLHAWVNTRCQVVKLFRVIEEIEQLGWIHGTGDKFPGPTADHHEWGDGTLARILSIDAIIAIRSIEAVKVRDKGITIDVETIVQRPFDQIHECWKNVQSGYVACDGLWRKVLWVGDQKRDTSRGFEPGHLVPR